MVSTLRKAPPARRPPAGRAGPQGPPQSRLCEPQLDHRSPRVHRFSSWTERHNSHAPRGLTCRCLGPPSKSLRRREGPRCTPDARLWARPTDGAIPDRHMQTNPTGTGSSSTNPGYLPRVAKHLPRPNLRTSKDGIPTTRPHSRVPRIESQSLATPPPHPEAPTRLRACASISIPRTWSPCPHLPAQTPTLRHKGREAVPSLEPSLPFAATAAANTASRLHGHR